ncbi:hypothetical protein GCK32_005027 [Trichostrongylus colubriformis]|uniref:Uncharacterized protein n=1 Tax=Trichostrongylus colubriformis TaxID=6319 RepID=A0AAN8F6B2_TRICO
MGEHHMDIDGAPRTSTGSRPRKDYAPIINELRSGPVDSPCPQGKNATALRDSENLEAEVLFGRFVWRGEGES